VRPDLTWRDVQHIAVRASQRINPEDPDWEQTTSGRPYSYKYGYGALDAWTYVQLARQWKLVKPQAWLELPQIEMPEAKISKGGEMSGGVFITEGGVESRRFISAKQLQDANFESLEHVTVKVWISHARRGDVEVSLVSPNGVTSILASRRMYDEHTTGYPGWQFMSVKHWYV
jgi:kexin